MNGNWVHKLLKTNILTRINKKFVRFELISATSVLNYFARKISKYSKKPRLDFVVGQI